MSNTHVPNRVMPVLSLEEYFRDAVHGALDHQHLRVTDHTQHYVVKLLTLFARADALHADSPGSSVRRPLAGMLVDAVEAPSPEARHHSLQRLGDVSLFVAGFFAGSFARRLVDVDYYIGMGGRAYGTLAGALVRGPRRALSGVFAELAEKFQPLVDALQEVADAGPARSDQDVLRLYELWIKTGSTRARGLLAQAGITPTTAALGLRTQ